MLQRSALRNIPLRLQLAYGAAKNPLELWQNAAWRKLERELLKSALTRLVAIHPIMQVTRYARNHDSSLIAEEGSPAC
jgi:hypothetical protein